MIRLSTIRDAFEGVIPSVIATTDSEGMPNASYLSHVYYIDDGHVALSNQFFSKTAVNVAANGLATVMVVDGHSGQQYILDLTYDRSETAGETFDRVAGHLEVMSVEQGMGGIMKLRALDIYRVEDCRAVPAAHPLELPVPGARDARDHLDLTCRLAAELCGETDAERLLDRALTGLETHFGFSHSMVLVPDNERLQLTTIASHGYDRFGFGSEVAFGSGVIGMAAATHRPIRISDLRRSRRYVNAVGSASGITGADPLPLPALEVPLSQMAVPMVAQGQLVGVLFVEAERSFAFRHRDEEALSILAGHLALALTLAGQERERPEGDEVAGPTPDETTGRAAETVSIRFYPRDGSVFIDQDYVIRGVPGRLLKHFVEEYAVSGRQDFLNREIRRDRSLQLPDFKDNLETRLILLRRRLEEKGGPIRITRADRGRIRFEMDGVPDLVVVEED
ncbi:GAF domain-containing protein [Rhizobium sp. S-51]|uniref:GAF domain-containing protein n=1 Tax=Rhizobium terricola TaxID=2728849 RepID=A0A7Y0FXW6_9HYPH|nr:GAF domain-containing protein [Rhizobium terricola]NML77008.1 GAF domain-containing protein [Rhizobium terricola]